MKSIKYLFKKFAIHFLISHFTTSLVHFENVSLATYSRCSFLSRHKKFFFLLSLSFFSRHVGAVFMFSITWCLFYSTHHFRNWLLINQDYPINLREFSFLKFLDKIFVWWSSSNGRLILINSPKNVWGIEYFSNKREEKFSHINSIENLRFSVILFEAILHFTTNHRNKAMEWQPQKTRNYACGDTQEGKSSHKNFRLC